MAHQATEARTRRPQHCAAKNAVGKRCGGYAGHGSRFCFLHDPRRRGRAQAARRAGGALRSRPTPPDVHLPEGTVQAPKTRADVTALLLLSVSEVFAGRLSPQRGKVVQDLARQVLPLFPSEVAGDAPHMSDEQYLAALEIALARCQRRIEAKNRAAAPPMTGAAQFALAAGGARG